MSAIADICIHKKSYAEDCKKCGRKWEKHKHIFNWHEDSTTRWEECRLCNMKKKPELPEKLNSANTDLYYSTNKINELIDYLEYLEERILKLEKGDD